MEENVSYAQQTAPCVCGRSASGMCNGNHMLSEEQYQFNLEQEANGQVQSS